MTALLSAQQAAEILGVSSRLVYQMLARQDLPSVRYGKTVRIPADGLEAFITQHTVPARDPNLEGDRVQLLRRAG